MKTKKKIIWEEINQLLTCDKWDRMSLDFPKRVKSRIRKLLSLQTQEIVEEIEGVLPKEEEFEEDESKYPDARWQKENYGKKKYSQAIRQVKHNISALTQTIKNPTKN